MYTKILLLLSLISIGYSNIANENTVTFIDNNSTIHKNGTQCEVCLDIVGITEWELNKTLNETEGLIKDLCKPLDNNITRTKCYTIVDDIDKIKNWIINGLKPYNICSKLGVCGSFLYLIKMLKGL